MRGKPLDAYGSQFTELNLAVLQLDVCTRIPGLIVHLTEGKRSMVRTRCKLRLNSAELSVPLHNWVLRELQSSVSLFLAVRCSPIPVLEGNKSFPTWLWLICKHNTNDVLFWCIFSVCRVYLMEGSKSQRRVSVKMAEDCSSLLGFVEVPWWVRARVCCKKSHHERDLMQEIFRESERLPQSRSERDRQTDSQAGSQRNTEREEARQKFVVVRNYFLKKIFIDFSVDFTSCI